MNLKITPKICTFQKFRVTARYKFHVRGIRKFCLQTPLKIRSRRSKAVSNQNFLLKPLRQENFHSSTLQSRFKPKFSAQNHFDKKFLLFDAPKTFQTKIFRSKPLRQENFHSSTLQISFKLKFLCYNGSK